MKKSLIIPDCHIPAHNVRAYALMLKVAKDFKPDEIVILGDFGDFYSVNAHGKSPNMEHNLKREVRAVTEKLRELETLFPNAKKVFCVGNHCHRVARYISDKAPELFGLVTLEDLLGLQGWTVVPYTPAQLYPVLGTKLYARHEPYGSGDHCAHATLSKGMASFVYGHTHREDSSHTVSVTGKDFRAYCPGWLGEKTRPEFSYMKGHSKWTLGFGLAYGLPNGNFFYRQVDISSSKCIFDGKLYEVTH